MINEIDFSKLEEIIGNFDSPFFNYLYYSYDLSLPECEQIIKELKDDIVEGIVLNDNLVLIIEDYFKSKIIEKEKNSKINYLNELLKENNDFFNKFLKKYNLREDEIKIIQNKVKEDILNNNISDFEIKRSLRFYFLNSIKQSSYLNDLNRIIGKNYDTLIINNNKKKYPILSRADIFQIISDIKKDIIETKEFKHGIKKEFSNQCMKKSEAKKAEARLKLENFVEGSGDSFSKLVKFKNLTKKDGELITSRIIHEINDGLIQPDMITGIFLTNRFNEYIK